MKKQEFKTMIDSSPEKVWETLIGETTYPKWTSAFAEGSSVETDWKKGSRAVFHDGKGSGMISEIAENKPNEYLSIRHLGSLKNGVEDFESEETRKWSGSLENYTLHPVDGKTELIIDMDMAEEYEDYFLKTWPKALEQLKSLAEKK